jgi:hypothetical protein
MVEVELVRLALVGLAVIVVEVVGLAVVVVGEVVGLVVVVVGEVVGLAVE